MKEKERITNNNVFSTYRDPILGKKIEKERKKDATIFWNNHSINFQKRACPICYNKKSISLKPYIGLYPIVKCLHCTLTYTPLAPSQKSLDNYYQNAESIKILNKFYKERKKENTVSQSRIQLVKNNLPEKKDIKILEIGCGNGYFLNEIKKLNPEKNIITYGVEPNKKSANEARKKGIEVIESYVGTKNKENYFDNKIFDIIICFELIEHLVSPRSFFLDSNDKLTSQGVLILSTPNIDGLSNFYLDYNTDRLITHAIAPPMHLQGFSRVSLAILANLTNFSILSIEAKGFFDIYELYLSLNESNSLQGKPIFSILNNDAMHPNQFDLIQKVIMDLNSSAGMIAVLQKDAS